MTDQSPKELFPCRWGSCKDKCWGGSLSLSYPLVVFVFIIITNIITFVGFHMIILIIMTTSPMAILCPSGMITWRHSVVRYMIIIDHEHYQSHHVPQITWRHSVVRYMLGFWCFTRKLRKENQTTSPGRAWDGLIVIVSCCYCWCYCYCCFVLLLLLLFCLVMIDVASVAKKGHLNQLPQDQLRWELLVWTMFVLKSVTNSWNRKISLLAH